MFNNSNGWRVQLPGRIVEVMGPSDALAVGDLARNHELLTKQLIDEASKLLASQTENVALAAENDYLKAELERLRLSSFITAVPSEDYERLIKAGDDMAYELHSCEPNEQIALVSAWFAAKEGRDAK